MNIRLDSDFRLRLTEHDVAQLLEQRKISQEFLLSGVFSLQVQVVLTEQGHSWVDKEPLKMAIQLDPRLLEKLLSTEYQKAGLDLDGIKIQADLWTEKTRQKLENR